MTDGQSCVPKIETTGREVVARTVFQRDRIVSLFETAGHVRPLSRRAIFWMERLAGLVPIIRDVSVLPGLQDANARDKARAFIQSNLTCASAHGDDEVGAFAGFPAEPLVGDDQGRAWDDQIGNPIDDVLWDLDPG